MRLRSPRNDCLRRLEQPPIPLVSQTLDIAVLWSAKAGCTFAVKWIYFQEGVLDEALDYAYWPHQYRQHVFYKREAYAEALHSIPSLGPRAIKFVRNPFDRAVSAYLAFCQAAANMSFTQHPKVLEAIGKHLGRPVGRGELFSFREYVSFLASVDLDVADIHIRRQVHPCEAIEALPDMTVLRVEDSTERLPIVEDQLGLRRSDQRYLRRSQHHTERLTSAAFAGDERFGETVGVPVAPTGAFFDDELVAAVSDLYAIDIESYGYPAPQTGPEDVKLLTPIRSAKR